jgi:hypothetical protein
VLLPLVVLETLRPENGETVPTVVDYKLLNDHELRALDNRAVPEAARLKLRQPRSSFGHVLRTAISGGSIKRR